ncbi:MAG TPA: L,D-transpeptidase, partial [Polyangiaceae bacterium]
KTPIIESPADVPESDNPYEATEPPPAEPQAAKKALPAEFDFGKTDLKLSDLVEGPESIIARRLVRGFYVAVDKEFPWNDRSWYKTTAGLVAPADRFADATPSTLRGVELAGTDPTQAVGFVLATQGTKYQLDLDRKQIVVLGTVPHFTAVRLTGRTAELPMGIFRETTEDWWMRSSEGTYTDPGSPPETLGNGEKWIDVNLSRQTLVAFEGTTPIYAALVASGRHAADPNDKVHDHRTIQGAFRIREKHISVTMDGDGPAPGDMPYSIEDVPYVQYFEGSYALHAAFWHQNFGHETSHGCVNLSPLDAKRLFFWSDPKLPEGWHGVIASEDNQGTRVVVHE